MSALELAPLWVSVRAALLATLITLVLGLAAAWWLFSRRGWLRNLLDAALTLPLVLPPTVVGLALLVVFGRASPLGAWLSGVGLSPVFRWPATVIASTVMAFPLMYRSAVSAFDQVDRNLLDAAATLGATRWRIFREVLVPLAWPGVVGGTVLAFARALGEFGATWMVAGNIPGETQTIPLAIYVLSESGHDGEAALWAVGMSLLTFGVMLIANRPARREMARAHHAVEAPMPWPAVVEKARETGFAVDITHQKGAFSLRCAFDSAGGTVALLGPSGSGKSATLRCIAGLEIPASGRIVVGERVFFDSAARVNLSSSERRVGMVFQDHALFPHLRVDENVGFGVPRDQREVVPSMLRLVGLEGFEKRAVTTLSGGQKQRVAIARALAMKPDILLLDEPFSSLDAAIRQQLQTRVAQLLKSWGGAAILVTHDVEEAYRLCPSLVVLRDGVVDGKGPSAQLFRHPPTAFTAQFTGCKNLSKTSAVTTETLHADDWGCTIRVARAQGTIVGIRAHHLVVNGPVDAPNTFPCWPIVTSEAPHRVSVMLSLRGPDDPQPAVQAEMTREAFESARKAAAPWRVTLPEEALFTTSQSD